MAIESINPANGKLLRSFEALTEEVISEKIALAAETFRTYPSIPLEHRALCMNKLASLLEQETEEIAPHSDSGDGQTHPRRTSGDCQVCP